MKKKHPKPTCYADDYVFNISVSTDVFTVRDVVGTPRHMLNILCEGTCFQAVAYQGLGIGIPSAEKVLRAFSQVWSSWAGLPQRLWTDRSKEFMGAFAKL